MDFFDSHAHLTSNEMLPHIEDILERAQKAHISSILNICTDQNSLQQGLAYAKKYHFIKNGGATTPHDTIQEHEEAFPLFAKAAREKQLCAIGETGLDYYSASTPKELQKKIFSAYLKLARETTLPVIFHCREAFCDLFSIVDAEYRGPAVVHCFTGTLKESQEALQRGWFLSFSGIVTFKKSESLREIVREVPLSRILIETDAPFLAPQSHRGKPNEPSFLPETAQCIASVKGLSIEDVAKATSENAIRLFSPMT